MAKRNVYIIGSSWIFRQGLKQPLKRLGFGVVREGQTFSEANADHGSEAPQAEDGTAAATLAIVLIEGADEFGAGLRELQAVRDTLGMAKLVVLADVVTVSDIAAAAGAGIDAVLSTRLPSRMLINSLQLVLHDQKLFPSLASLAARPPAPPAIADEGPGHATGAGPAAEPERQAPDKPATGAAAPIHANGAMPGPGETMNLATPRLVLTERRVPPPPPLRPGAVRQDAGGGTSAWSAGPPAPAAMQPGVPSEREWEILFCVSRGGSNKVIARELGIAETTVKVHIKSLLRKLGVANRTQAAIWALNQAKAASATDRFGPRQNGAAHQDCINDEPSRSMQHAQHR